MAPSSAGAVIIGICIFHNMKVLARFHSQQLQHTRVSSVTGTCRSRDKLAPWGRKDLLDTAMREGLRSRESNWKLARQHRPLSIPKTLMIDSDMNEKASALWANPTGQRIESFTEIYPSRFHHGLNLAFEQTPKKKKEKSAGGTRSRDLFLSRSSSGLLGIHLRA